MHVMKKWKKHLVSMLNKDIEFSESQQYAVAGTLLALALLAMLVAVLIATPIFILASNLKG